MFELNNIPAQIRAALSDDDFKIYAKQDAESIEILMFDDIGDMGWGEGIAAADVAAMLSERPNSMVNARINSFGGLAYDGLAIHNAFKSHQGKITATIEGIAFSAASIVALGADHVRMHQSSDFGIHRALGGAIGNAKVMRGYADWLDRVDGHLHEIYEHKTGASPKQVTEWLDGVDDGTVFSAKEAHEHGFADEVIKLKTETNSTNSQKYAAYAKDLRKRKIQAKMRTLR